MARTWSIMMRIENTPLPTNKKFGFFWTVVFLVSGFYFFTANMIAWFFILISISCITLTTTILKDDLLYPLNKFWMRFGTLLGKVISPIMLGMIFFCMFAPLGIALRLKGRDELYLRPHGNSSHWKKRDINTNVVSSFKNQF
jgi:hypothetical protein